MRLRTRGMVLACAALLVAIAAIAGATAGGGRSATAASHAFTPATASAPHASFLGFVSNVEPQVHFSCQDAAGCYDPTQIRKAYGFG